MMTTRERFKRVLIDKDPSVRTLKWEFGYWGATINNWYRSGLPKVNPVKMMEKAVTPTSGLYLPSWRCRNPHVAEGEYPAGFVHTGGALSWPTQGLGLDSDVKDYFHMDQTQRVIDVNLLFHPMYEVEVVSETDDRMVYRDIDGVTKMFVKEPAVIPTPLEYPVTDWESWNRVKEERVRFDNIRERLPENWEELVREYRDRDYPLGIGGLPFGNFGTLAHIMGYDNLFYAYYEDPELVHDIIGTFTDLWIAVLSEILKDVELDYIEFWEDISGNLGPMVSPATMREFMLPYYRRITDFCRAHGVELFFVDTDGDCSSIIPVFLDSGINVMYPFEVHAGMDVLKVRRDFPQLACTGGIDKLAISCGREKIDELLAHVRETLKLGGYIPHGDHLIPPEVDFENFRYYRTRLNEIIEEMGRE